MKQGTISKIWTSLSVIGALALVLLAYTGRAEISSWAAKHNNYHTLPKGQSVAKVQAYDLSPLVSKLKPAVFNISVKGKRKMLSHTPAPTPFGFFGGPRGWQAPFGNSPQWRPRTIPIQSAGSGFVINEQGYALTNEHVIRNAEDIKARFADGRSYKVKVVGKSRMLDLALVKLLSKDKKPFSYTYLGRSEVLKVGVPVIAIGNARGLGLTVTSGIVSAKGRVIGSGQYDDYIQTDAAINQGNSGGPLFNRRGEVVGINTAILRGGRGIGFAIPVDLVRQVLPQLRRKGKVERAQMGVVVQRVTPALARTFGLPEAQGALINKVSPGSAAERAGLKVGDVILKVNGREVRDHRHLTFLIAFQQPGKTIPVQVMRQKRILKRKLTLQVWQAQANTHNTYDQSAPQTAPSDQLGLALAPLKPADAKQLGIPKHTGMRVTKLSPDSIAQQNGLRVGDIILEVNRTPLRSSSQLKSILSRMTPGENVLLRVQRGDAVMFLAFPLS